MRHLQTRSIRAEAIHGNKTQNARQRALSNFANDKVPVLVATDIASRGIDVDGITHVVNYDLTHEPETYVHRIGPNSPRRRVGRGDFVLRPRRARQPSRHRAADQARDLQGRKPVAAESGTRL